MKHQSICWHCKNACGGCSWSRELVPPKDCKIAVDKMLINDGNGRSHYVDNPVILKCPEFVPDAPRTLPHVKGKHYQATNKEPRK